MKDLPLNALRSFAAVYETGGVRPAGRRLGVTHSSISRHLGELEKWLGIALFETRRTNRTLRFSAQGEALGRAVLESLQNFVNAIEAVRQKPHRNAVVVSTTPSFAALWLLPRLPAFQESYPGIELSVVVEQRLIEPSEQGADIAIRMGKGPWANLNCEALMDDELFPVMSRGFWEQSGKPDDPNVLPSMQLLHDRDPNAAWSTWLRRFGPKNVDTSKGPRFASSDIVIRAAAQGLSVALARGRLVADDIAAGALVRPFAGTLCVNMPDAYWIVRPSGATERAAIPPVIAWLKSQAQHS